MKGKRVFIVVLDEEPFIGVYSEYRRAVELLFSEYAAFLDKNDNYNGKMVAYDLEQFMDEGYIPQVGRIYERMVE